MAIIIGKRTNLDAPIKVESLNGVTFTSESEAHQFVVRCAQNGQDLTLAGTISAKFIRADGNTIQLVGSIVDGAAVVTLAQDCYNVQGRFQLAIFNTVGDTKLCIYACVGTVQKAQSGNLIDGGNIIQDVEDLIAEIQTTVATLPPDYLSLVNQFNALVLVQDTQPSEAANKLWVDSDTVTETEVPTMKEFNDAVIDPFLSVIKSGLIEKPNGANLFNKESSNIVSGYFNTSNGTINSSQAMSCIKIEVSTTGTYSLLGATDYFSAGEVIKIPVFYASNGEYIATKFGTLDANTGIVTVSGLNTIEGNAPTCLIGYSFRNNNIDNAFVTEGSVSSVPDFKYLLNKKIALSEEYSEQIDAIKEQITDSDLALQTSGLIERPNGINLFNKNSAEIETGLYYNANGTDGSSETMGRILIEVPTVGTYSLLGATSFYGASNVVKIPIFRTTDSAYIGTKVGTLNASNNIVTISGLDSIEGERPSCYIGYSFKLETIASAFVSNKEETEIPDFIFKLNGQIEIDEANNTLKRKTAVFFGDSICDATAVPQADTEYYRWGWAGRIGNANDMVWHNYGSSGASITRMSGRGCIQDQLPLAVNNYPDADYIILEGGTNDADVIASDSTYSIGTFDRTDYTSEYDGTTFCGALETFLRNTIQAYPTKKIGFIIAQKMGIYMESLLRRRNLFDIAKQICEKWGVPCIDIWEKSIINPKIEAYYDSTKTDAENIANGKTYVDGQHLTDVGYDAITPLIELWMKEMR